MFGRKDFNPAIYYGELPKKFKGKVELLRAVSTSIVGKKISSLKEDNLSQEEADKIKEDYKEKNKSKLEKKVMKLLKKSEGDLILLEEPKVTITNYDIHHTDKREISFKVISLDFNTSVNGTLYKTNFK